MMYIRSISVRAVFVLVKLTPRVECCCITVFSNYEIKEETGVKNTAEIRSDNKEREKKVLNRNEK